MQDPSREFILSRRAQGKFFILTMAWLAARRARAQVVTGVARHLADEEDSLVQRSELIR